MEFPTFTCKNSSVTWKPVRDWSYANLNTLILRRSFNNWLSIHLRMEFKILLIIFKVLQGLAPKYLIDLISVLPPSRYDLRRNNNGILWALQSVSQKLPWRIIDPSWRQRHGFGTVFLEALDLLAPKVVLNKNLKPFYSAGRLLGTISYI